MSTQEEIRRREREERRAWENADDEDDLEEQAPPTRQAPPRPPVEEAQIPSGTNRDNDIPVPNNTIVASEFGGYFVESETRMWAVVVLLLSITAAITVITSQVYRFVVLDPPCEFLPPEVNSSCTNGDPGLTILSAALNIIVSLSIPLCGLYGSIFKTIEALQLFRFMSGLFGLFAVLQLGTNLVDPRNLANGFSACDVGQECLTLYFIFEVLYGINYLFCNVYFSGTLMNRIEQLDYRLEHAEELARDANVLQNAEIVRVIDTNLQEDDQLHPLARAIPEDTAPSTNTRSIIPKIGPIRKSLGMKRPK